MLTKLFHVEVLRRIQVNVSQQAQAYIDGSTKEGRLFPLALAEHFGADERIQEIAIDTVQKETLFPGCEDPDTLLFTITIKHVDPTLDHGLKVINAADLQSIHPSGAWGFHAASAAQELLRLHLLERGW